MNVSFEKGSLTDLCLEVYRFLFVIYCSPVQSFVLGEQKQCCVTKYML